MERIIEVKNLVREYERGSVQVLKGVDFRADRGDFIAVMGRSGSGKSTLLRVLGLIDKPDEGEVFYREECAKDLWVSQLADIRRRELGYVYQDARLMDCLTVGQNMKLPLILDKQSSGTMQIKLEKQCGRFLLTELVDKYPHELSGGEKQRVAMCRALISSPELILADEPTGNLDTLSGNTLIQELQSVNRELKKTVILVTHDPKIASHSKTAVLLKDGRILNTLKRPQGNESETQQAFFKMIIDSLPAL